VKYEYIELEDDYSGEITSVPTTIVSENETEVARIVGFKPMEILTAWSGN
jgi:hypothetical protein